MAIRSRFVNVIYELEGITPPEDIVRQELRTLCLQSLADQMESHEKYIDELATLIIEDPLYNDL